MDKITTSGTTFIDSFGRERIFCGINICDKGEFNGKTRDYVYSWVDERIKMLKICGMNIIRLGITWDAVEPEYGIYNDDYLDAIEK